jgi:hypothetical protein
MRDLLREHVVEFEVLVCATLAVAFAVLLAKAWRKLK